jgi:hypothetical protein
MLAEVDRCLAHAHAARAEITARAVRALAAHIIHLFTRRNVETTLVRHAPRAL